MMLPLRLGPFKYWRQWIKGGSYFKSVVAIVVTVAFAAVVLVCSAIFGFRVQKKELKNNKNIEKITEIKG